ncbi:hypothetical protein Tco_0047719 [Tanacetum coccineum]
MEGRSRTYGHYLKIFLDYRVTLGFGSTLSDEEGVAIDAIPLATKPPSIVDYKIIKEGKISIYQIIRADGSSKRYSAVIHMLRSFDREDLETLWKIVKARHGYTRPEEGYERVLWGDLKTMFEHHVEDLLVLLVQSYNCLFRVNAAGTKLQLLKDYNCSRIKTAEKIKIDWRSRILTINKIPPTKVFRAKEIAMKQIRWDHQQHYVILRDYAMELKEKNKDTTMKIQVETNIDLTFNSRVFKRIYVCLGPLKAGYRASKRELLRLDGCFIKGPFTGQILTVFLVDSENGVYHLAYAIVEADCKSS